MPQLAASTTRLNDVVNLLGLFDTCRDRIIAKGDEVDLLGDDALNESRDSMWLDAFMCQYLAHAVVLIRILPAQSTHRLTSLGKFVA